MPIRSNRIRHGSRPVARQIPGHCGNPLRHNQACLVLYPFVNPGQIRNAQSPICPQKYFCAIIRLCAQKVSYVQFSAGVHSIAESRNGRDPFETFGPSIVLSGHHFPGGLASGSTIERPPHSHLSEQDQRTPRINNTIYDRRYVARIRASSHGMFPRSSDTSVHLHDVYSPGKALYYIACRGADPSTDRDHEIRIATTGKSSRDKDGFGRPSSI
jgi:hypothetical protein